MAQPSLPLLLVLALATPSLSAQSPRASVRLTPSGPSNAGQVGVGGGNDLVAVVWGDVSARTVSVAISDGRGVAFNSPVVVSSDANTKTTQCDSVQTIGDAVYVVWRSGNDLYFARSLDRGVTFSPQTMLSVGGGVVSDWGFAASGDPAGDHLYVASATTSAGSDQDMYVTASHDGGATFSAGVAISTVGSVGDTEDPRVAAAGNTVHVVWADNRSGRDTMYYQRSADGGATFLLAEIGLGDAPGVEDAQAPTSIGLAGNVLAVGWNEEETGSGNEVYVVNVSTDGGLTFGGSVVAGNYTAGTHDVDEGAVAVDPATGNVVATWEDNRLGLDEIFVAVSTNGGVSFLADAQLSTGGAEKPRVVASSASDGRVAVAWEETVSPRSARAALSADAGLTFGPELTVSDNGPDTVDFVALGHDAAYGNFVAGWVSLNASDFHAYAGGFRGPTLVPQNMTSGGSAHFDLTAFTPGPGRLAWVLGAVSQGSLLLPLDGRDVGLTLDALLLATLNDPITFLTSLSPTGTASSGSFPLGLPPGATFFAAAVSFDVAAGLAFVELTDVETVVVQ